MPISHYPVMVRRGGSPRGALARRGRDGPHRRSNWSRLRPVLPARPGTGPPAAGLDELPEAFQVALDPVTEETALVGDLFGRALGLQFDLGGDPGVLGVQPVEGDHAALPGSADGGPRHPLVG